jgi:hypothetical protein
LLRKDEIAYGYLEGISQWCASLVAAMRNAVFGIAAKRGPQRCGWNRYD